MARLIRRTKRRGLYTGLKRAACLFLAVLLSGGVWLSVDAEARAAFFGWVSQRLDGDYHYFFQGGDTAWPEDIRYTLSQVPEGYAPYDHHEDGRGLVRDVYTNPAGLTFSFEYLVGDASQLFLFTGEEGARRAVTVHGTPADFYPSTGENVSSTLVWRDEETGALLYISGCFHEETLIQLAESVEREER